MYEKQRMTDVFRVPFVVPAPKVPWDGVSEWIVGGDLIPQSPPVGFQLQKLTFFPIGDFETYLMFVTLFDNCAEITIIVDWDNGSGRPPWQTALVG